MRIRRQKAKTLESDYLQRLSNISPRKGKVPKLNIAVKRRVIAVFNGTAREILYPIGTACRLAGVILRDAVLQQTFRRESEVSRKITADEAVLWVSIGPLNVGI